MTFAGMDARDRRAWSQPSRLVTVVGLCALVVGLWFSQVHGQTGNIYYIGAFSGSSALNDTDCGTGRGAHPNPHPCATLAYWNANRDQVLNAGDAVRIAAGTYGPVSDANHCIQPIAGVMYEGRNANDTVASSAATVWIDVGATPNVSPCQARSIVQVENSVSGFALRSITLSGATNPYSAAWFNSQQLTNGLTFRYFRHTGSRTAFVVGATPSQMNPTPSTRNVKNFVCDHCEFDNSQTHGLDMGMVDGFTFTSSTFHDNASCSPKPCYVDNNDGIHFGGAINGTITASGAWNNGQYGFDFTRMGVNGDNCTSTTHDIVVDSSYFYSNGDGNVSFSGCVYRITVRNSYLWGAPKGFNMYYCAGALTLDSNTVSAGRALQAYSLHKQLIIRDNIFTGSGSPLIWLDMHTTGVGNGNIWDGNVLSGAATTVSVFPGDDTTGANTCVNDPDYTLGAVTSARGNGSSFANNASGLTAWRNADYFGATVSNTDRWGVTPSFVNAASPSAANLHLDATDTVARGVGLVLTGFSRDYDGDLRSGLWDIGADQISGAALAPPTNLRVAP